MSGQKDMPPLAVPGGELRVSQLHCYQARWCSGMQLSSANNALSEKMLSHYQRGLVGDIVSRFEKRGQVPPQSIARHERPKSNRPCRYKLAAIKLCTPSKEHLEKHYEDLSEKPFFKGLVTYMLSGPICAMVWEGRDAVKTGRSTV